jgi:uncharacterized membrane protein YfcA
VQLTALDYLAAAGAAGAAGAINALAGGGTLVSFPTLVALGVPPVAANVTNTVALVPGYLAGSWTQREDLRPQLKRARSLAAVAAAGGLGGSVLLVTIPGHAFRVAVPYLILASCLLLFGQDRLRQLVRPVGAGGGEMGDGDAGELGLDPAGERDREPGLDPAGERDREPGLDPAGERDSDLASRQRQPARGAAPPDAIRWGPLLPLSVFAAAVYGGFFGAGLGIMLLAVLGMFSVESLVQVNALKQVLQFVINLVAAALFAFSGHVRWDLAPIMAAASLVGGVLGSRLVRVIDGDALRWVVVVAGVGIAVAFWVT